MATYFIVTLIHINNNIDHIMDTFVLKYEQKLNIHFLINCNISLWISLLICLSIDIIIVIFVKKIISDHYIYDEICNKLIRRINFLIFVLLLILIIIMSLILWFSDNQCLLLCFIILKNDIYDKIYSHFSTFEYLLIHTSISLAEICILSIVIMPLISLIWIIMQTIKNTIWNYRNINQENGDAIELSG